MGSVCRLARALALWSGETFLARQASPARTARQAGEMGIARKADIGGFGKKERPDD
jgi:hypothetical protein